MTSAQSFREIGFNVKSFGTSTPTLPAEPTSRNKNKKPESLVQIPVVSTTIAVKDCDWLSEKLKPLPRFSLRREEHDRYIKGLFT